MGDNTPIQQAIQDLHDGKFILIYDSDDREGEADFVIASQYVTADHIKTMRQDGGGLIFLMTDYNHAQQLQIPFLTDLFEEDSERHPVFSHLKSTDIPYDDKSSFSLYINHRKTYTGITDRDRALTSTAFAKLIEKIPDLTTDEAIKEFGDNFRTPGHIPICVAQPGLVEERQGHTELVMTLLHMSGLTLSGSGCEIMGDDGRAKSKKDIDAYGKEHNLTVLTGNDIIEAWKKWPTKK